MLLFVVFDLVLSCGVIVVTPCCRRWRNNLNEPLDPFPFWVTAEQKGGRLAGLRLIHRWSSFTG